MTPTKNDLSARNVHLYRLRNSRELQRQKNARERQEKKSSVRLIDNRGKTLATIHLSYGKLVAITQKRKTTDIEHTEALRNYLKEVRKIVAVHVRNNYLTAHAYLHFLEGMPAEDFVWHHACCRVNQARAHLGVSSKTGRSSALL